MPCKGVNNKKKMNFIIFFDIKCKHNTILAFFFPFALPRFITQDFMIIIFRFKTFSFLAYQDPTDYLFK